MDFRQDAPVQLELVIYVLFVMVILLSITYFGLKTYSKRRSLGVNSKKTSDIQVLETLTLSLKTRLYLVKVGDQHLLISESASQVQVHPIQISSEHHLDSPDTNQNVGK